MLRGGSRIYEERKCRRASLGLTRGGTRRVMFGKTCWTKTSSHRYPTMNTSSKDLRSPLPLLILLRNHLPKREVACLKMRGLTGERTVKRLRLSKALTVPENTSVQEACRRMAARRVDALLLTDSNALLCGILTDKDIATRVISRELDLEETLVSKVMTRNPIFVLSDTFVVEALQKMVQASNEAATNMMQKFWDSAMALSPNDDDDESQRMDSRF